MKNSKVHESPSRAHEQSNILSDKRSSNPGGPDGKAITGFPWQFTLVLTVIVLGILMVILKGSGIV